MKALVGIESLESAKSTLNMLSRLRPRDFSIELLHVLDAIQSLPGYGLAPQVDVPAGVIQDLERIGQKLLKEAEHEASLRSLQCTTKLEWGPISSLLLSEATSSGAELIALHRRDLSRLERLFLGSLTRTAMVASKQSVLVTKGEVKAEGPIHAVFGLDHSQYCFKSLEVLEEFHCAGLKKLTFASAYQMHYLSDPDVLIPPPGDDDRKSVSAHLEVQARAVCERFSRLGLECDSIVEEGAANRVLKEAMAKTGADLMIVGAQGHGFLEQLLIGSVALHQVATEPYSVLVLRV